MPTVEKDSGSGSAVPFGHAWASWEERRLVSVVGEQFSHEGLHGHQSKVEIENAVRRCTLSKPFRARQRSRTLGVTWGFVVAR